MAKSIFWEYINVEIAPSNRTKCANCKKIIEINTKRIKLFSIKNWYGNQEVKNYYHIKCFIDVIEEEKNKLINDIILDEVL
jgi:hypothetical protein